MMEKEKLDLLRKEVIIPDVVNKKTEDAFAKIQRMAEDHENKEKISAQENCTDYHCRNTCISNHVRCSGCLYEVEQELFGRIENV